MSRINRRRLWHRFLVICALSAAAVAAPLLDLYGKNPEVFVANRASKSQIVLFALMITLAPPLIGLLFLGLAEKIGSRTATRVYVTFVGLGGAALGLVISRQAVPDGTVGAIILTLVIASVLIVLRKRVEGALVLFSLALPAVLILFLVFSATSRLIWEQPAAAASIDTSRIGQPHSIVFIQLDEFPTASIMNMDGSVNETLFPNFARLADSGTWYRNALSASIATTQSVPAALTGRFGSKDLSPSAIDHPDNLFTLLGSAYEMHVIEWVADLCPEDVCEDYAGRAPARFVSLVRDTGVVYGHLSLPAGARDNLPSIDNTWKGFLGQEDNPSALPVAVDDFPVPKAGVRSEWIDWIQRIINGVNADEPPTLHYAHLKSPHVPWVVNPSGTHYERPEQYSEVDGVQGSGFWDSDPNITRLGFQRHLYQLGFLDTMLGSLFDRLEETGSWDDAMIIVVADHGASFVPGEHRRWPYENNRDDLYRVPLFLKYPGQTEGMTRDEPAFTIDILPTIMDALDISSDWDLDGISLLDIEGTDRPHTIIYWCCSTEGASTDLSVLFDQVARNHQWVPGQDSWTEIAAVGPNRELVGTPVVELSPVTSDDVRWSLDHADALATVDRRSGMVQTLITGRLELPADVESDDLLIAVNGRVAGAGFISRDTPDGGQIRGLVAEDLMTDGANELTILVPTPDGSGWLTGSPDDVNLEYIADDGHVLALQDEGNRRLQVDEVTRTETGWHLVGWAADVSRKVTADRFYVFAGDSLVAYGPPNLDNPNVVRWYKSDDLLRSGFSFEIDAGSVPDGLDRLTVVAEFGDYAISDPAVFND